MTTQNELTKMLVRAGRQIGAGWLEVRESGQKKEFVACWQHGWGRVEFDGGDWKFIQLCSDEDRETVQRMEVCNGKRKRGG
jgi:hypothetical protein